MKLSTAMSPILVVLTATGCHNPFSRQRDRSSRHLLAHRLYFATALVIFIFLAVLRLLTDIPRASSIDIHRISLSDIAIIRHWIWSVSALASGALGIFFGATNVWRSLASAWSTASGDEFVRNRTRWKYALLDLAGCVYLLCNMINYLLPRWQRFTLCFAADAWKGRPIHLMLFDCSRPIGILAATAWKLFPLLALAVYAVGVAEALNGIRQKMTHPNAQFCDAETLRRLSEDHRKVVGVVQRMNELLATFVALQLSSIVPMASNTCYLLLTKEELQPQDAFDLTFVASELMVFLTLILPLAEINMAHSRLFDAFCGGRIRSLANNVTDQKYAGVENGTRAEGSMTSEKFDWLKQNGLARRLAAQLRQDVGITALRSFIIKRITFVNIFASVVAYLVILVQIPTSFGEHSPAESDSLNTTSGLE